MMESSNLNLDLHHQEQLHASSFSSFVTLPSLQELILNNGISSSMVQELEFHWNIDGDSNLINQENYISKSDNDIKELGISINLQDQYINIMSDSYKHEFNQINGLIQPNFEPINLDDSNGRGSLPSANFPTLSYLNHLYATSSLGMRQPSLTINNMDLLRENIDYGQLQRPTHASMSTNNNKVVTLSSISGVTESKRSSTTFNCKASQNHVTKRSRFDSSSSFTPFKVRKEKLGGRIAALQQLVAPFGKTDTASVLMEAIGYIKFLQGQVETLSAPYMNTLNKKKERSSQGAILLNEEKDEEKRDLRSRGLCLVPLSCMSYVTTDSDEIWSPDYNYCGGV